MRNLGPKSRRWLPELKIFTRDDLNDFGAIMAYRILKDKHSRISINLLWPMVGCLKDCDWRDLSPEVKNDLRRQLERLG